jgi:uncharacterized protein with ParB-like and HNH nuclease domain
VAEQDEITFDDYAEENDEIEINEYDITASPNDFNVSTIFSFIESGAVRIPGFQRNYVWDSSRASKLIESLILGIPVPQIFLYETDRNQFMVIDGQQRLMSIYYFIKQRFPKKDKRAELRNIFDEHGTIPDNILHEDSFFENFRLKLPELASNNNNRFKGLSYSTLGSYKTQFDMRVIRNVIIKQNSPQGDDSAMYEVFNRLNTGGINLKPQEIRTSMYHSAFYEMLNRANSRPEWRRLLANQEQDLHMKDVEILLRGFAMLIDGDVYAPSMIKFLNLFSRKSRNKTKEEIDFLSNLLDSFLQSCRNLPVNSFLNKKSRRFNVALFEASFAAVCKDALDKQRMLQGTLESDKLQQLENDVEFLDALKEGTTQTKNVKRRIERAAEILGSL